MSKKNRQKNHSGLVKNEPAIVQQSSYSVSDRDNSVYSEHKAEYKNVSSDLIRVVILNGIFLAVVLVVYYINKSNPFLDNWYSRLF